MAKTKISEYSSTASNNTDVDGINIAEGMAPSNVNNAMREIMAQLKDWQSGAVAQDMYVNGAFTASGNAVLSADLSVGDDLTVTGKANISGASVITTGTYGRTGTTVTVTKNSHGFENNQILYLAFSSGTGGSATSGAYAISNVATNTFDVTDTASGSISGTPSVTITRGAISASGLVVSSPLAVGGNATIAGTLSAGSTSLGAATFSGAVIMSSTLAANGNVTVGTSTTNSHTLNGNLTVGTSTSNTVTLNTLLSAGGGTGASGQVLKSRGTANTPEWGSTISSGTSVSASGTYVDFILSSDVASYVKRITVMFSNVSTNGTSNYQIQLGDSGGIETSGYIGQATSGSTAVYNSSAFLITAAVTAATTRAGIITIALVSNNTWVSSGVLGNTATNFVNISGGTKELSDAIDRIRITTVNGTDTFDAGSINIMYE